MAFDFDRTARRIFTKHPARFGRREKDDFLRDARDTFIAMGYPPEKVRIISHSGGGQSRNLIVGDPGAPWCFTAHYDTPGKTGFLLCGAPVVGQALANVLFIAVVCIIAFALPVAAARLLAPLTDDRGLITAAAVVAGTALMTVFTVIPMFIKNRTNRNDNSSGVLGVMTVAARAADSPELRDRVCFVLFDNEEWGLIGSAHFVKWCRRGKIDTSRRTLINLDCVGVGDILAVVRCPGKNPAWDTVSQFLERSGFNAVRKTSALVFMSDHANFQNSVMLSFTRKSLLGPLYIPNLHSGRDSVCDTDRLLALSEALARLAAQEPTKPDGRV